MNVALWRVAVVAALLLPACGRGGGPVTTDRPVNAAWEQIAVPLPPRVQPALVATDDGFLVVGGVEPFELPDCPPDADCAGPDLRHLSDGSVFNARSATWNEIAVAPKPLWRPYASAWTGSEFVTFGAGYNITTQAWRTLPPPVFLAYDALSWTGQFVTTTGWDYDRGERNGVGQLVGAALDPSTGQWRIEPWPHEPPGMESARSVAVGSSVVVFVSTDTCKSADPYCTHVAEWQPASSAWRDVTELPSASPVAAVGADEVLAVVNEDDIRTIHVPSATVSKVAPADVGVLRDAASNGETVALLGMDGVAVLDPATGAWRRFDLPSTQSDDLQLLWAADDLFLWDGATVDDGAALIWRLRP